MCASWVVRHNNSELSLGLVVMCVVMHKGSDYSLKPPISFPEDSGRVCIEHTEGKYSV